MNEVDDFLAHYGVIGMKWGMRRQAKLSQKIDKAKSEGNSKKVDKLKKRKAFVDNVQNLNATKATQKRVAQLSTGKAIAQSLLLGGYGSKVYNSARAKRSASRGSAAVEAVLMSNINVMSLGILQYVERRR